MELHRKNATLLTAKYEVALLKLELEKSAPVNAWLPCWNWME